MTLSRLFHRLGAGSLAVLLTACATHSPHLSSRQFRHLIAESPVFQQAFTGFALYDPLLDRMVYEYQSDKYFTPASNTKILTLYTCLQLLGDSLPALRYDLRHDTLFFTGTGDPTLLHPDLPHIDTTYEAHVFQMLRAAPQTLCYVPRPTAAAHFGPGWAWDDYNDYYSAERSTLPLYGNIVRFQFVAEESQPLPFPAFFGQYLHKASASLPGHTYLRRQVDQNHFSYAARPDTLAFTQDVPFRPSASLTAALLADTLHRPVVLSTQFQELPTQTLYSLPADSAYRWMMHVSDNFFAEQLLMLCSAQRLDTLSVDSTIAYMMRTHLTDLPDPPRWVDGSGLSRYNLQTPRNMVALLRKIDAQLSDERLYTIFPAGGKSGTLRNWYGNPDGPPYVFAKTGSLSNTYCLSGYLITQDGRKLIFSFMHNNFVQPSSDYRHAMQEVLRTLWERY
ncbi:D-alanyl-D-alanine carboxypeptidase / D-alanyl-D-alanine-endopeptidase (penicillin-binding protein 4) [Catalinimonas alkaloidigena]|uniref:D-alanyl-D-alanine carboxypeptidase / D-alanyl-D-alanine-endopeptidase (Penicillin-binding protein 4) n=1 Tax=Catalinimonas alkaloidigena TaxID=1075417 RepID=A0A1G9SZZ4_9BACT|nr:D-alanyl-D-alanine carboxypeptidase [Catalinimonas alkaloidigena]SDM41011.1 D-alanyl-D-alanine carboxypeptidase / D-alanyl-D-alanine-endopeptidase (penicillin-binding protein 4) [Catalinimonas alkaloidigena]